MHKEERRTINVVIVSSKLIDRACSFVPLTTSTPRITTFEDGKPGYRDAGRRFDDHRAQRGCEGLRGQRASVCIQVVRFFAVVLHRDASSLFYHTGLQNCLYQSLTKNYLRYRADHST